MLRELAEAEHSAVPVVRKNSVSGERSDEWLAAVSTATAVGCTSVGERKDGMGYRA
jgi:hypothetical protein